MKKSRKYLYQYNIVTILIVITLLSGCAYVQVNETAQVQEAAEDKAATKGDAENEKDVSDLPEKEEIKLDPKWDYAEMSEINSGTAVLYRAPADNKDNDSKKNVDRKDIVIAVNAGHGTIGGEEVQTYCHPDKTPKITDGSNPAGSLTAIAISTGMIFADGTPEAEVTLAAARILKDRLLEKGYDVLMIRDEDDVQLDNVARTVIANNTADCLVSLHYDGDGLSYDKGCFFIHVPEEICGMEPVKSIYIEHESLGEELINALGNNGQIIYEGRNDPLELTQTCYATIPAVVIELGNGASAHEDKDLEKLADALTDGIDKYINSKTK